MIRKHNSANRQREWRNRRGVTLVELLVAMTIFITLMSSLVLLFSGTVRTMRAATTSMEVHDIGRAAFEVLERDIYAAAASREQDVNFNFYGAPFGFMAVGADDRGRLSRVSYVLHPDAESEFFDSTLTESWQVVYNRVLAQARQLAVEENIDPDVLIPLVNDLFVGYYPMPDPENPTQELDFPVRVETWSLVRYEEPIDNLNVFHLPNDQQWPYIDPRDPNQMPPEFFEPESGLSLTEELLLTANLIRDVTYGNTAFRVLGPSMTERVVAAKRRELWLRILGGEAQALGVGQFWSYDDPARAIPNRPNVNEYVLAEGILRRAYLLNPTDDQPLVVTLNGEQYPLDAFNVNGIFRYGFSDSEGGAEENMMPYFNDVRNIRTPGFDFRYAQDMDLDSDYNYEMLVRQYETTPPTVNQLIDFDNALAVQFSQSRMLSHVVGSPLLPRTPALVEVDFYLAREREAGGGQTDFRRRFSRVIEVPTGAGRDLPMNIVRKPGVS